MTFSFFVFRNYQTFSKNYIEKNPYVIRLHHLHDGSTYPKYKLLCFIYFRFFNEEQNTLAFNWDTLCHLALCLQMIILHLLYFKSLS
jgi:hypothetical protein